MTDATAILPRPTRLSMAAIGALVASPAIAIFLATNLANAGNLAFNMVFSRLLSPAEFHDLAVILTLKLAIVSVFGAVQMAVSQLTAGGARAEPALDVLPRLAMVCFVALFFVVPLLLPIGTTASVTEALGLGDHRLLGILLLSLPITAPLCFGRGAALGRMAVRGMVWSANLEMIVKLAGALAVWTLGLGLPGIVAVIGLSMVAGWYPVRGELRHVAKRAGAPAHRVAQPMGPLARRIALLALPFAILQLSQVGHLDGDLLISAAVLDAAEADLIAGLALIQRIQFYACFGLAGVLLPAVTAAAFQGQSVLKPALPVALLVLGSGATLALAALIAPELVIVAVAGPGFAPAAPGLLAAIIAAFAFTGTYLAVTLLTALGDRSGITLVIAALPVVIAALWLSGSTGGLAGMMTAKAMTQVLLFILIAVRAVQVLRARDAAPVH